MLPDEWDGRTGKDVHVVIKRKAVDTRAMYGLFKTKPGVPLCSKCHTPFNYSWRNGGGSDKLMQQRQQRLLDAALSRPTSAASTAVAAGSATDPALSAAADGLMNAENGGVAAAAVHRRVLAKAARFIRGIYSQCRRRRAASSKTFDGRGGADAVEEPELWYGREFRRQLMTYFKPELSRPAASGGRYPVGARVACFAGKDAWYPGAVAASRENNTYDVRYDNGDIAQHVFSHMIRFEPVHADSRLTCCYYGLALAAAAAWPLAGSWYFSSTSAATDAATSAAALVALPALVVGTAGTLAVAFQIWEIYADNRSTGLCVATKFAVIFALPSMSLTLVGGLAVVKALGPASAGSWVEMLLLPSMLFSLTGGGYAHAVSPAYGKAWAMASSLWLLFLLLVALRLDGERGDARPAFGKMRWLGVYFPLWVFLLMLIAAHEALPYVWDIDVFQLPARPPPPPLGGEGGGNNAGGGGRVRGVLSRLAGRLTGPIAARRERSRERTAAAAAAPDTADATHDAGAGGTGAGDRAVGDEAAPDAL
ncbi:unnamed protein product [Ectocarpus sp. CCAP 1310/34]|nr:unnamed protein product [Ectocarpus sp. CCAP 1310/34]